MGLLGFWFSEILGKEWKGKEIVGRWLLSMYRSNLSLRSGPLNNRSPKQEFHLISNPPTGSFLSMHNCGIVDHCFRLLYFL